MYFVAIASTCVFRSRAKARSDEHAPVVVLRLDHPLPVVERELRVDRDEALHLHDRIDALAAAEAVLQLERLGREPVAEEVRQQELSEPAAGLRRPQRLLELAERLRLLEHLRGRLVDLRRGARGWPRSSSTRSRAGGRPSCRAPPSRRSIVSTIDCEPPVDVGVPLAELRAALVPHRAELGPDRAREPHRSESGDDENDRDDGEGDHGSTNARDGVGRRPRTTKSAGSDEPCGPSNPARAIYVRSAPGVKRPEEKNPHRATFSVVTVGSATLSRRCPTSPRRRSRRAPSRRRSSARRRARRTSSARGGRCSSSAPSASSAWWPPSPSSSSAAAAARRRSRARAARSRPSPGRARTTSRRCRTASSTTRTRPTTGPHNPVPAPFDFYEDPVDPLRLVHNQEHGGVVLHYGNVGDGPGGGDPRVVAQRPERDRRQPAPVSRHRHRPRPPGTPTSPGRARRRPTSAASSPSARGSTRARRAPSSTSTASGAPSGSTARCSPRQLGGLGEIRVVPSAHAARPADASSVAPIALLSTLPASLPQNEQRTPSTNGIPPIPPSPPMPGEGLEPSRPESRPILSRVRLTSSATPARPSMVAPAPTGLTTLSA